MTGSVRQVAPYPTTLFDMVGGCTYRPGWSVYLEHRDRGQGSAGLTLVIKTKGYDSYHPERGQTYSVYHYFPVVPAAYNERSWKRWLFERFCEVERHEAAEFFRIDGQTVYPPNHGPGNDPYQLFEVCTPEEADTSFRGIRNHPAGDTA